MSENEFEEFFTSHPNVMEFFTKNERALLQFNECWKCKFLYLYEGDSVPFGKCTHPKKPMMKVPCEFKKKKWDGEKYGISVPKLKE